MKEPEFVTVFHSQGMLQAQVIRGKLESAGVPVYLKYESIGQVFGLTVDGLGLVQVQVPADWQETAVALLADDDAIADSEDITEQAEDDATPADPG
jgi:hypothetical protein